MDSLIETKLMLDQTKSILKSGDVSVRTSNQKIGKELHVTRLELSEESCTEWNDWLVNPVNHI